MARTAPPGSPLSGGDPSPQLQRRLAFVQYLLHQVRSSRLAYYPGSCGGGLLGGDTKTEPQGDTAADVAASGAEGLADALSPSARVADLLDALDQEGVPASSEAPAGALGAPGSQGAPGAFEAFKGVGPSGAPKGAVEASGGQEASRTPLDSVAARDTDDAGFPETLAGGGPPSWGSLCLKAAAEAGRPLEGLELYLCERLLPLIDEGVAALCAFVEKLQADAEEAEREEQAAQQQQQQQTQQQQKEDQEAKHQGPLGGGPRGPRGTPLALGRGLRERFDPLVWLGQHLLRQGRAFEVYEASESPGADPGVGRLSDEGASPRVRGEHLCLAELPLYGAIRAAVKEERSWRALEALKPRVKELFQTVLQEVQQERQQQQEGKEKQPEEKEEEQQQRQSDAAAAGLLPLESLLEGLKAVDSAWGLPEAGGFCASVSPPDAEEGDTEEFWGWATPRGPPVGPAFDEAPAVAGNILPGACAGVALEVAYPRGISFEEFWRFLAECLDVSKPLKASVFSFALKDAPRGPGEPGIPGAPGAPPD